MKVLRSSGAGINAEDRVFIAIPSYDSISCETAYSLFAAKEVLLINGIESEIEFCTDNCHVDDGRNYLVRSFLESKCNQLVFIDSDIRFDPKDLVRLIKYTPDVVAGIYSKKKDDPEYPVQFIPGDIRWNEEGLIPVRMVSTGFLKIRRRAFETLYHRVSKYIPQIEINQHSLMIPEIFERKTREHTRLGGDYEFCQKWVDLGGEIFIDPFMTFGHVGKKEYTGILGTHLIRKNGLSDDYIVGLVEKFKARQETPRDHVILADIWNNAWTPPIEMLIATMEIARNSEGLIVEIGSGLTTLLLGSTGRRVVSLEHDKAWFNRMSDLVKRCGLLNTELVYAPIKDGWYDTHLHYRDTSLVFVDGPTRNLGDRKRLVYHLLNVSPGCAFIVDDCDSGLDITKEINEKFGVNFKHFGRYAIGVRK